MLATVLIFAGFKIFVWATISAEAIVWTTVAASVASTARLKVGWSDRSLAILGAGIAIMLGLYTALGRDGFALQPDAASAVRLFVEWAWLPALVAAVGSIRRPVLVLIPSLACLAYKRICELETGVHISETNYLPVVEIGILIALYLGLRSSTFGLR